ncbi:MAG: indole-3-glycerol phosphate synthase TrpC [Thiohalospira sp.]
MSEQTPDILRRIVARKEEEVAAGKSERPLAELRAAAAEAPEPRGFETELAEAEAAEGPGIIAEIKRASPSRGVIREDFDPEAIAESYAAAGATCLSVLTDRDFFQGAPEYLQQARAACDRPVLRKDFIIDPWQVVESRAMGADCILLIAAILSDARMDELAATAEEMGLDILVEVHDETELRRVLDRPLPLVGINNRDLRTFETRLETSLELAPLIPGDRLVVSESAIHTPADIERLRSGGIGAYLVGEAFMRAPDPGEALRALFAPW